MEQLFGGGFDLAAVASAAGLGGSAIGAVGALVFFKGFVMRVLSQVVVTAALTGVGFLALLNVLGFQITPKPPVAAAEMVAPSGAENFSVQSVPTAPPPEEGVTKTFYVQSPFRKS